MERKGDRKTKHLIATDKGNSLVTVMPEQIQSASMTAEWEQKLLAIEHSEYDAADFMDGIAGMIAGLVANYEKVKGAETLMRVPVHSLEGQCLLHQDRETTHSPDRGEAPEGWPCPSERL